MLITHIVIAPNNHSSEVTPKSLNAVGKDITIGILLRAVIYHCVGIPNSLKPL